MAPRANWKGYLKLSLVSCAVALYPATTSSARVSFNTLNRETGNRVKLQYIDAVTGEVVESDQKVKGYQVGKGAYIQVEDEDIDAIRIESTHTIDIESFVPRAEVDERYLDAPYYIAPDDQVAQEAFAVIRDAMREKGKAGVGRVVMSRRERMVLLEPLGKGILATLLRYPYEVRGEETYFDDIPDLKIPAEMRDLAGHIIQTKAGAFAPDTFEDRYEKALVDLLQAKQRGNAPREAAEPPKPSNVVNLMDALRRSIDTDKGAGAKGAGAKSVGGKSGAAKKAETPKRQTARNTGKPAKTSRTAGRAPTRKAG